MVAGVWDINHHCVGRGYQLDTHLQILKLLSLSRHRVGASSLYVRLINQRGWSGNDINYLAAGGEVQVSFTMWLFYRLIHAGGEFAQTHVALTCSASPLRL
jgi:hypothetical protein